MILLVILILIPIAAVRQQVDNIVHARDLHATMLHQLGIRHDRFTSPFQGLDMKLTGVEKANFMHDLIA